MLGFGPSELLSGWLSQGLFLLVWASLLALWLGMLVHCLRNHALPTREKVGWGIGIVLGLWVGALAYALMRPAGGRPRGLPWLVGAVAVTLAAWLGAGFAGRALRRDAFQQAVAALEAREAAREALKAAQAARAEQRANTDWAAANTALVAADANQDARHFKEARKSYEEAARLAGLAATRAAAAEQVNQTLRKQAADALAAATGQYNPYRFRDASEALAAADAHTAADDLAAARAGYEKVKALVANGLETLQSQRTAAEAARASAQGPVEILNRNYLDSPAPTYEEAGRKVYTTEFEAPPLNQFSHGDDALGRKDFEQARSAFEAAKLSAEAAIKRLDDLTRAEEKTARDARAGAQAAQAERWANAEWTAANAAVEAAARSLGEKSYHKAWRGYRSAQEGFRQALAMAGKAAAAEIETVRKLKEIEAPTAEARAAVVKLQKGLVAWAAARRSRPVPAVVEPDALLSALGLARENLPPPLMKKIQAAADALAAAERHLSDRRPDEAREQLALAGQGAREAQRMLKAVAPPAALRSTPRAVTPDDLKSMARAERFRLPSPVIGLPPDPADPADPQGFVNVFEAQTSKGEGVVVDHATGLMWPGTVFLPGSPLGPKNEAQARDAIRSLNAGAYAGFTDWRLPTVEELSSLIRVKPNAQGAYIDELFKAMTYWSSDEVAGTNTTGIYWGVQFFGPRPALITILAASERSAWVLPVRTR